MNIVNIIIYYLFYSSSILHLLQIEGANGHTSHYDYTQYDYMWQIN